MNTEPFLLSASHVRMPRLIYGTAWKKERTAALVETALRSGFRGIDTACQPKHYNEAGVGAGIAASIAAGVISRDELYLQTKFTPLDGHDPQQIPYDPAASLTEQVAQSFRRSLQNLQTDYLDGLVLHSPLGKREQLMEVWKAMEQPVSRGQCKQLGISNCYALDTLRYLYDSASVKPAVLQNRFYADTDYDKALRDFCRQHHIVYQSFWTLTANPGLLAHPTVSASADKYRHSPAQVFFRYLTQAGIVPLTGTTSEQHMREDLAIFEFELAEAECAALGELL
ncbi:aldo/keto reductase family protein [Methylogaea oryzae]|uniref:D-xylose reductase III n=1 Tax=Methylogaea oryzae TaxID=1295382 RepID=A0A8D4VSJ3_9GAMM|nr:aldo/keto reductase [Methylogaea oryzae]BBL72467.1 D-xylose reductase III [Methylogaea oryzae]